MTSRRTTRETVLYGGSGNDALLAVNITKELWLKGGEGDDTLAAYHSTGNPKNL